MYWCETYRFKYHFLMGKGTNLALLYYIYILIKNPNPKELSG